jgi:NAD(P)-dependent dehydrogenase (short-subunit alcohol dehydrogenase family)
MLAMVGRLTGKVAIVTGAGSRAEGIGNGKAAAVLFAREGASVVCVDKVASRAEETVAMIVGEAGTASVFECDVSRQTECQRLADATVERYGRLDILQNNVGIPSNQPLAEITEEAWDQVMAVNVRSMVLAAQAVAPRMALGGGGSIINISSIAGLRAYPARSTAYTTSKAAVIGLTMALAGQLGGQRIRVNCIAPGQVFTPLIAERIDAEGRQRRATSGLIKMKAARGTLAGPRCTWPATSALGHGPGARRRCRITITIPAVRTVDT